MSINILLDDQIEKLFNDSPELNSTNKNKFEIAVAAFANLKHLNGLEIDDLIDGIMGDGGDEGIDHCYIFNNGNLVTDETQKINKESNIKVKFFQTKKENSFSTDGFRKLKEGIEEIFNLELDLDKLQKIGANKELLNKADLIRKTFRKANTERANFSCEVFYVTASPEIKISEKINHLADQLRSNKLGINFEFSYWGTQELLNLTKDLNEKIEIKFTSQPLELKERDIETSGFAGFVTGQSIVESLLDKNKKFKSHLTEGNIRFFLGEDTNINSSIIETAKDPKKSEIFWAMNNGLTIVSDSITPLGGSQYSILNPQIVNGCQTIHCLYDAYKENSRLPDTLKVFIKLVNTQDIDAQTNIISATNSQNPVKTSSLKANDDIQRNIERHLKKSHIYYERRENYYKRQGLTGNKVIGLLKMAQIIHTTVNKESIVALNDTASLFTNEKYKSIFHNSADFGIYEFSTILYQKIWSLKNSDIRNNEYNEETRELISKGGLIFLHCISSILLSRAEHTKDKTTKPLINPFSISAPARKNEFTLRKTSALALINDEKLLKTTYEEAKSILLKAAEEHSQKTGKPKNSLLKNRRFDKDYLIPEIKKLIEK